MMWSTCHEHGTKKKIWVPDRNWTNRSDALTTELRRARDVAGLYTRFLYPVLVACWSHNFSFFHRALNFPSLFITHKTIVFYPARQEFFLAQWLEHLTRVKKVINSIPCSCSWHVDHIMSFLTIFFSRWSPVLSPFKLNLFSSTFTWYYVLGM